MKAFIFLFALGILSIAVPAESADTAASRFQAAKESSFSNDGIKRNPFWPVGWEPKKKVPKQQVVIQKKEVNEIPKEAFRISTILLGELPLAVINGGEYTVGETVDLNVDGQKVSVRIVTIGDGFVKVNLNSKIITMRR